MKRNRVNVLTVVNFASNITTETIDGYCDAGAFWLRVIAVACG